MVDPFRMQYPTRKLYSFTSAQGKSRGDRIYVSDHNIASIKNIRYINTPFLTAHKMMTFDLQENLKMGPGSWKMNSSILHEDTYKTEIEEIFHDLEVMNIQNPVDWWDLFLTAVQGTTKAYTKRKARIKNSKRKFLNEKLQSLEEVEILTSVQMEQYAHYKSQLNEILENDIRGHDIRTRCQPSFEINEPDISMYSKFEKRYQKKQMIYQLADENDKIHTDQESLLGIADNYYKKLFKSSKTNVLTQTRLLKNITKQISINDKNALDSPLTAEELEKAVKSLPNNKSPGPDGISAKFYKTFWYLIKDRYLLYINTAKRIGFREYAKAKCINCITIGPLH